MTTPNTPSDLPSRVSTPSAQTNSRFTSQVSTAEDILKTQTIGLVKHADFRKRRAEALEQKELEAEAKSRGTYTPRGSGASTPNGASSSRPHKKKRKAVAKGKLSFGLDDEEEDSSASASAASRSGTPVDKPSNNASPEPHDAAIAKKRLGPNATLGAVAPKVMTKSALLREAQTREQLRKEFITMQENVKSTEILLPFVFYDGTNIPGGVCKVKKGDYIWVFLDKSRKVGAELGVGSEKASNRREWARVGVDDLMLVRGEIIIPHHYDFYYFIVNKTKGHQGKVLFDFSSQPATDSQTSRESSIDLANYDPLSRPSKKAKSGAVTPSDSKLEGYSDDPNLTKVVDRRWYERNKHIFPASVWEEFDPSKDYTNSIRKDAEGNSFFFS
ncbi:MAG: hypothetical protein M1834_004193 [Cirrosporium novae-zelandiae]|nr:MAG: hypothetical protein M1834_004193 [Cirrosporium novae-zelandiae]